MRPFLPNAGRGAVMNFIRTSSRDGFTLIELSIVLVIIGLIVGGVLVGQDLIKAAQLRAQITQIEKFNTAVNTFQAKYNGLPGDLPGSVAGPLGFVARSGTSGLGDGNGLIQGYEFDNGGWMREAAQGGETLFFWEDLSSAGLIDGTFNTASNGGTGVSGYSTSDVAPYFPQAKIGNGNVVYVYSGGSSASAASGAGDGNNYFGFSVPTSFVWAGDLYSSPGITVAQAYAIDSKIDDGLPYSGNVLAVLVNGGWNATNDGVGGAPSADAPSSTTCVDYSSSYSYSAPPEYSMSQNGGAGVNCALSFKAQF